MDKLLELLINRYVFIYVILVIVIQFGAHWRARSRKKQVAKKRRLAGLGDQILVNQSQRLEELKAEARNQALVLLLPIVILPFVLVFISHRFGITEPENGLLFNGTEVAKAALGGMAFRTVTAFSETFQVGDRATLRGFSGKVIEIGIFYIKLQTVDDDLVSIPTTSLWSENLVSSNAGERASLCAMPFFLSLRLTQSSCRRRKISSGPPCSLPAIWTRKNPFRSTCHKRRIAFG